MMLAGRSRNHGPTASRCSPSRASQRYRGRRATVPARGSAARRCSRRPPARRILALASAGVTTPGHILVKVFMLKGMLYYVAVEVGDRRVDVKLLNSAKRLT